MSSGSSTMVMSILSVSSSGSGTPGTRAPPHRNEPLEALNVIVCWPGARVPPGMSTSCPVPTGSPSMAHDTYWSGRASGTGRAFQFVLVPLSSMTLLSKVSIPSSGRSICAVGSSLTIMTLMLSESLNPSESVAVAVIVCKQNERSLRSTSVPVPISPSLTDVQTMLAPLSGPSSGSLASAVKGTFTLPLAKEDPSAGVTMEISGGFGTQPSASMTASYALT